MSRSLNLEEYQVFNKARRTCLAAKAKTARSVLKRMRGLGGRSRESFPPGSGLWISPCNGIHTFGMRFPIDAVYLDSGNRVIRLYHRLKPFRIAAVVLKAHSVLELPPGTLEETRTRVGDELEFRPCSSIAES